MLITVDFEKMIEDDHEHCCGAEEEGEGVEGGVGDHFFFCCFCLFSGFWGGVCVRCSADWWFGLVWWWWLWLWLWLWWWCVLGFNGEW